MMCIVENKFRATHLRKLEMRKIFHAISSFNVILIVGLNFMNSTSLNGRLRRFNSTNETFPLQSFYNWNQHESPAIAGLNITRVTNTHQNINHIFIKYEQVVLGAGAMTRAKKNWAERRTARHGPCLAEVGPCSAEPQLIVTQYNLSGFHFSRNISMTVGVSFDFFKT